MLWDTAGQEEFDAITKAYYRGKVGQGDRFKVLSKFERTLHYYFFPPVPWQNTHP